VDPEQGNGNEMGIIGGMNRGPKFPPRARRAAAKLALTDPDQIEITGNIAIQTKFMIPIVNSDHTDSTDLPTSPDDGQMVLLVEGASISVRLCIAFGDTWYEEVLSVMS
jgi:hypothetical protein